MIQIQFRIKINETADIETDIFEREDCNEAERTLGLCIQRCTQEDLEEWAKQIGISHEMTEIKKDSNTALRGDCPGKAK
jgi:endogenous inhibitor of DNA gyrase (YacG/DUF329 family)